MPVTRTVTGVRGPIGGIPTSGLLSGTPSGLSAYPAGFTHIRNAAKPRMPENKVAAYNRLNRDGLRLVFRSSQPTSGPKTLAKIVLASINQLHVAARFFGCSDIPLFSSGIPAASRVCAKYRSASLITSTTSTLFTRVIAAVRRKGSAGLSKVLVDRPLRQASW